MIPALPPLDGDDGSFDIMSLAANRSMIVAHRFSPIDPGIQVLMEVSYPHQHLSVALCLSAQPRAGSLYPHSNLTVVHQLKLVR